jgi:hypothetical protein
MLNQKNYHVPRDQTAEKPLISINAMAFAKEVATEFEKLETGYRNGLYNFYGRALTSYRKFLKDPDGYKELLGQDNIAGLREKPDLKTTSRLVLYYLTGARNDPERNTAGKYARVVDYLHQERIGGAADAAEHIRSEGGLDAILKKVRGREAPKVTKEEVDAILQGDNRDFDEREKQTKISGRSPALNADKDLSIRVAPEVFAQVFGPTTPMHKLFYLECKKVGSVDRDGIRIDGRLVDLVDPPSE